jgi:hypothetical protein
MTGVGAGTGSFSTILTGLGAGAGWSLQPQLPELLTVSLMLTLTLMFTVVGVDEGAA